MRVQRFTRGDGRGDAGQILFIGRDVERARAAELLGQARGKPVLTVTEAEGKQPQGGIIHFVAAGDKVRFDISRDAEEQNGLRLASPLLAVAREVKARAR